MTSISHKTIALVNILYIYYLVYFLKSNNNIKVLINFNSEVNIITFVYTLKLDF